MFNLDIITQVLLNVKLIKFVKKVIMNKWATTVRSAQPSLNIQTNWQKNFLMTLKTTTRADEQKETLCKTQ